MFDLLHMQSGFVSGRVPFEEGQLEAAVSGVVYEVVECEEDIASCQLEATLHYIRQLEQNYNR